MKKNKVKSQPQIVINKVKNDNQIPEKWQKWLVFGLAFVLYLNTISHDFTQDDAIVITDNMFTTKGITGISDIFSKDTFYGFFKEEGKANLVSGGRYRPFTLAMFALEYQFLGKNPLLFHFINILLYAGLCLLIYQVLAKLFYENKVKSYSKYLALTISLIYAAHPLHTEAVANIKDRDEIMAMGASALALYFILKDIDNQQIKNKILAIISFFIGLLSKENTITFLAIIPLVLYFFKDFPAISAIKKVAFLLIPTAIFLIIRFSILGFAQAEPVLELMNNPFVKLVNGEYVHFSLGEKLATIIFTLGKYLQLLLFPITLTHDYYPRYIDIMSFSNIWVIISLLAYCLLAYIGFKSLKSKSIIGFGIIYFLITLLIVSNLIFSIGTNMAERFMFMPSLGFAIIIGYLLQKYFFERFGKSLYFSILAVVLLLFSFKTFTRNQVWESDFKLFQTDVKTSTNSAKVLNAAAGSLSVESAKETDPEKKKEMLDQALVYINQAIEVHPTYKNAHFIKGNILNYLADYDNSIKSYNQALAFDANFIDAKRNLALTYRDAGRNAGEKENNLPKAELYLSKSDSLVSGDGETMRLLGVINGVKGDHQKALTYFEKVLQIDPTNASANLNLGLAYQNLGNIELANRYIQKAKQLDPKIK